MALPFDPLEADRSISMTQAERGAVFTRLEVVDFILDLVGYTPQRALTTIRLLEPAVGHGDFLLPAIDRLLAAWRLTGGAPISALTNAIRGVELDHGSYREVYARVVARLTQAQICRADAEMLANTWLIQGDFLLTELGQQFHIVVGNPPYVRQELIPSALLREYRRRFSTIYDRADLYIPFIEHSLRLLERDGELGFICADRWMKNRYGSPLRQMIADDYHLKIYVDMVDTPAFHSDVIAYPAITVIARAKGTVTRIAQRPQIDPSVLAPLAAQLTRLDGSESGDVRSVTYVAADAKPWLFDSTDQIMIVRRLERDFPTLEEASCRVGIGVATGADNIFIAPFAELDVEEDRKLPLVTTRDIHSGSVIWRGLGVINPFEPGGGLVQLNDYPRLKHYLDRHRSILAQRHVAQKTPAAWYRTIDRIDPALAAMPKLLIPDIKGEASIVYEPGQLYPHHNLYFITSNDWDLKALQAVLRSGIAQLFVSTYSTKMRGGYLRFQAQYLRRIRVPRWRDVSPDIRHALTRDAEEADGQSCNALVYDLYGLSAIERAMIAENGA